MHNPNLCNNCKKLEQVYLKACQDNANAQAEIAKLKEKLNYYQKTLDKLND